MTRMDLHRPLFSTATFSSLCFGFHVFYNLCCFIDWVLGLPLLAFALSSIIVVIHSLFLIVIHPIHFFLLDCFPLSLLLLIVRLHFNFLCPKNFQCSFPVPCFKWFDAFSFFEYRLYFCPIYSDSILYTFYFFIIVFLMSRLTLFAPWMIGFSSCRMSFLYPPRFLHCMLFYSLNTQVFVWSIGIYYFLKPIFTKKIYLGTPFQNIFYNYLNYLE